MPSRQVLFEIRLIVRRKSRDFVFSSQETVLRKPRARGCGRQEVGSAVGDGFEGRFERAACRHKQQGYRASERRISAYLSHVCLLI